MIDGKMYRARMQFLTENPFLCDTYNADTSSFVLPPTPIVSNMVFPPEPVVLLASRGGCSFARKAAVAESIHPRVEFLLIMNYDLEGEDMLVPMYSEYGDSRLVLLSITYRSGMALRQYLEEQTEYTRKMGGPLVALDAKPPPNMYTAEDIQEMMLKAIGLFFLLVSFSGCIMILVGTFGQVNGVPSLGGGPSRMTEEQVLQLPHAEPEEGGQATTCAICLDEATTGWTALPCQHHFHTECIVPWLTERQSKCPLCKYDVLQHVIDSSQTGEVLSEGHQVWFPSWWTRLTRFRWMHVQTDDRHHNHDGIVIEAHEMELTEQRLAEQTQSANQRQHIS